MKKLIFSMTRGVFVLVLLISYTFGQPPVKIPYQAVIRTGDGNILASQSIPLKISILEGSVSGDAVYTELHTSQTTPLGVVTVVIGEGNPILGTIDGINWKSGPKYIRVEADVTQSGQFILIGTSPILSVPYALEAGNSLNQITGQQGQIVRFDGSAWSAYNNLRVSPQNVVINAPHNNDTLPIFQVKNQDGQVLFSVTNKGVIISLADNDLQGKFTVKGKQQTEPYLTVSPDSTRIHFNIAGGKSTKGGFAIGGLSSGKLNKIPYFSLTPSGTDLLFEQTEIKSTKGGFAIGGIGNNKQQEDYFELNPDSIRFYIRNDSTKSTKGGFAIGGLSSGKPRSDSYLSISPTKTTILFDETQTQTLYNSGFVIGRVGTSITPPNLLTIDSKNFALHFDRSNKTTIPGFNVGGITDSNSFISYFNLNNQNLQFFTDISINDQFYAGGNIIVEGQIITLPEIYSDTVMDIFSTSALAYGTLISTGNALEFEYGFVWSSTPNPSLQSYLGKCTYTTLQGSMFSCSLTGLIPQTTYYVRAYAKNSAGTVYGELLTFQTLPSIKFTPYYLEVLFYSIAVSITVENAPTTLISDAGIIWDTTDQVSFTQNIGLSTNHWMGGATFYSTLNNLKHSTNYFWRAFLITSDNDTILSPLFQKASGPSPVALKPIDEPTSDGAFVEGAFNYLEYSFSDFGGFVWGTSPNVDTLVNIGEIVLGYVNPYTFQHLITGLEAEQTYYVRAFAKFLDTLVYYSEPLAFTTEAVYGSMIDASGNVYPTKYIGRYRWMTTNLRATQYSDGSPIESNGLVNPAPIFADSLIRFGRLYSFQSVAKHILSDSLNKKICPLGWRLPTNEHWQYFAEVTNSSLDEVGKHLKDSSLAWLSTGPERLNTTGFSALPAGKFLVDNMGAAYSDQRQNAYFWTEPEPGTTLYTNVQSLSVSDNALNFYPYMPNTPPPSYVSVRCIKTVKKLPTISSVDMPIYTHNAVRTILTISDLGNAETGSMGILIDTAENPSYTDAPIKVEQNLRFGEHVMIYEGLNPNTNYYLRAFAQNEKGIAYSESYFFTTDSTTYVLDNIGIKYPTVTIGGREWMAKNLSTNKYNNGELISGPPVTPYAVNQFMQSNGSNFGYYYQAGVFLGNPKGICPTGWGIPRMEDWMELIDSLGGVAIAGKKMKNSQQGVASNDWNEAGIPGDNSSGLNVFPAGHFYYTDIPYFTGMSDFTVFWSRSLNMDDIFTLRLTYNEDSAYAEFTEQNLNAYSVRCVKDTPGRQYKASVLTDTADILTSTSIIARGIVVDLGNSSVIKHGICYSTTTPVDTTSNKVELGNNLTDFMAQITGLTAGETYYFRSYLMTPNGLSYGNLQSVEMPYPLPPEVTTIMDIDSTFSGGVRLRGTIVSNGYSPISSLGFEIDVDPTFLNPIEFSIPIQQSGTFKANVSGLTYGETYYFRAFAENSEGISYGETYSFVCPAWNGTGELNNPYIIDTWDQLYFLSQNDQFWANHFKLGNNIDASASTSQEFSPIGNTTTPFSGTFNGNNKTINNLTIYLIDENVGLFGYTQNAQISNLKLQYCQITGDNKTGALAGVANNSTIINCVVKNSTISGQYETGGVVGSCFNTTITGVIADSLTVSGTTDVGGSIGFGNMLNISESSFVGTIVLGSLGGGFIGNGYNVSISKCYTVSTIEANSATAGGFAGTISGISSLIENCYSQGTINSSGNCGGFISQAYDAEIINCYANVSIGVSNAGFIYSGSDITITNCYYNRDKTEDPSSSYGTAIKSVKFARKRTFNQWDFNNTWATQEFYTFPYLKWQTDIAHNVAAPTEFPFVTDIDGNRYGIVTIGTLKIFDENLRVTRYRNGTPIPKVTENSQWSSLTGGGYCWYNNDSVANAYPYGALYNYYAIDSTLNSNNTICPPGWRTMNLTNTSEIQNAIMSDGFGDVAGSKLKSRTGWESDGNGDDSYGFEAFPGGERQSDGTFTSKGYYAPIWLEELDSTNAFNIQLLHNSLQLLTDNSNKRSGIAVRCVQ